ncbi:nodulation protein NfeD [bacterium]|nr:nodulation protein NfeD [bacterium]
MGHRSSDGTVFSRAARRFSRAGAGLLTLLALILGAAGLSAKEPSGTPRVDVAVINGMIGPVSQEFIRRSLERAEARDATLLVIQLDTPGGMLSSTREIVKMLLGSRIPVAVYVAPSGSRAGSAGVFITLAAHVAAMAPGTNIGAAHPVSIGLTGAAKEDSTSTMSQKILNDTAAFIKTIAEQRDRNVAWADSAVRYSVSITEKEALERRVIDLVAPSVEALVDSLDGRAVALSPGDTVRLALAGAQIETYEYSWRFRLLDMLTDPNVAYILFLLGLVGLYFELSNPGLILPGVVGGICIILAFYAFQTLPINYAGVLLIVFATILFIVEIKVPSFGLLTLGGVLSLVLGSIMLFKGGGSPTMPEVSVSWSVLIPTVTATVAFFVFVVGKTVQAHRRRAMTGRQGLIGSTGKVIGVLEPEGKVFVHGEIWRAVCPGRRVEDGQSVRVISVSGLLLTVEPLESAKTD